MKFIRWYFEVNAERPLTGTWISKTILLAVIVWAIFQIAT
jgi:hypothetical protein